MSVPSPAVNEKLRDEHRSSVAGHSGGSRNPRFLSTPQPWIPAFAGMTDPGIARFANSAIFFQKRTTGLSSNVRLMLAILLGLFFLQ